MVPYPFHTATQSLRPLTRELINPTPIFVQPRSENRWNNSPLARNKTRKASVQKRRREKRPGQLRGSNSMLHVPNQGQHHLFFPTVSTTQQISTKRLGSIQMPLHAVNLRPLLGYNLDCRPTVQHLSKKVK